MVLKKLKRESVSFASPRSFRNKNYDITYLLANAVNGSSPIERVKWLKALTSWVRSTGTKSLPATKGAAEPSAQVSQIKSLAGVKLRYILQLCERQPDWGTGTSTALSQLAGELSATELFCDVGIFSGHGMVGRITHILIDRYLPIDSGRGDLDQLFTVLFPTDDDANWVEALPADEVKQLLTFIEGKQGRSVWNAIRRSFADGMLIMASQVMGAGTEREMRERVLLGDLASSAFFRLLTAVQRLHPRLEGSAWVQPGDLRELDELQQVILECSAIVDQAFSYLAKHGVSVGLVFRFERIELYLGRLLLMTQFLTTTANGTPEMGVSRLLAELIRSSLDAHRIDHLFSGKMRLLSRRIVDHTGDSGEHYIMRDLAGYLKMVLSAAGGGLFTVGTTIIKAAIAHAALPVIVEALAHACNYAGSFLAMHFCHFTLATKQPSMTASTLARKLSEFARGTDREEIIATIRDAFRSQFAAAIGNVGAAIPIAALVTWSYQLVSGKQVFTTAYAHKTLASLDPLSTLTVPYAILTGFLLWIASLLAGAVENWMALHQVAQRIECNPYLRFRWGPAKTERFVQFVTRNLPGAAGSVILGILLALIPFLGVISGLPLDVRHVTLSSSALSISLVTLGDAVDSRSVVWAAIGIGLAGFLNFGVSFFLALSVASRAQNVRRGLLWFIAKRVVKVFLKSPLAFFWPPSPPKSRT